MLPLPSPPTDNLYKFCAIMGIVIVTVSVLFPGKEFLILFSKVQDLNRQVAVAAVEVEMNGRKLRSLLKLIENTVREQNDGIVVSKDKLILRYSEEEIKKLVIEAEEVHRADRIRTVELEALVKMYKASTWMWAIVGSVSVVGVFIGTKLASFGFRMWHEKVQRPIDKALAKGAAEPETST